MYRLTRLSLGKIPIVIMLAILIIIAGLVSVTKLKTELLPDIGLPNLSIVTIYPGAGPEDVQRDISDPLQKALAGSASLKSVRATSNDSVSVLSVQYEYGTDMEKTQSAVEQLIAKVTLPSTAQTPTVGRFSFQDIPIVAYTLNTSDTSADALANLKSKVNDQLVPLIQAVDGVNSVVVAGGGTENVTITYDAAKLAENGLTATQVNGVLQANNLSIPGGAIINNNQSIPVVISHQFNTIDDLNNLMVGVKRAAAATTGAQGAITGTAQSTVSSTTGSGVQTGAAQAATPVKLSDVATVALTNASSDSISRSNGKPSIAMLIYKTQDGNTVDVAHKVADVINANKGAIGTDAETLFDSSTYIEDSLNSLIREGILGAVLAIAVILLFLLSVRSTLVTAISIPISVLIAFILLNVLGVSLNIMSLAGLAVAVGRVVDDSIVVLENIFRHISEGESVKDAAFNGTKEVATAITASTITTVCVFLPLGFLAGLISEIFRPFAIAVSVALLASLLVALTVVPAIATLFIKANIVRKAAAREHRETLPQKIYTPVLTWALKSRGTKFLTLGLAVLLFIGSLIPLAAGAIGFTFISFGSDKVLNASLTLAPGADLQATSDTTAGIESQIQQNSAVKNYQSTIGSGGQSASFGGGSGSSNAASLTVNLNSDANVDQQADWLRNILKSTNGLVDYSVTTGTNTGFSGNGFSAVVSGSNYDDVTKVSDDLVNKLKTIPDLTNVSSDAAAAKPELRIDVDPAKALAHGSTTAQIAQQVRGLLTSQKITSITIDSASYDVMASYDPAKTNSVDQIKAIPVGTVNPVALSEIADVQITNGPVSITEVDQKRSVTVSGTILGTSTSGVTAAARTAIDQLTLGAGTAVSIGGVTQQQTQAFGDLGTAILIAVALVYIVMVATFGSLSTPFVILFSLPLAAIGSLLALWITGKPLGVSALIGVLMLIGIVVTNAIVLLDLVEQFKAQGISTHDALIRGGRTRVRPILMTAIATIIALIPLAMSGEGSLIASELGTVVIGGLFSATFLTLIVVPVIYSLFDSVRHRLTRRGGEPVEEQPARVQDTRVIEPLVPEREPELTGARSQQEPAV